MSDAVNDLVENYLSKPISNGVSKVELEVFGSNIYVVDDVDGLICCVELEFKSAQRHAISKNFDLFGVFIAGYRIMGKGMGLEAKTFDGDWRIEIDFDP